MIANPVLPYDLPKHFYSEIRGLAGHVLFFAPGLLHQGNSNSERLDFHFRFSNCKVIDHLKNNNYIFIENHNFDFKIPNFYSGNFDIKNDLISSRNYKISQKVRLINSINYYTGFYNIFKYLKGKFILNNDKSAFKFNFKANTIFQ